MTFPLQASRRARLPLLTLVIAAPAFAQEPRPSHAVDVHEQMRRLLLQIEQGLKHVDGLLCNADARPAEREASSVASRLVAARNRSQKVVDDIDRLLRIRHHPHDVPPTGGT